ncbi:MAG TPA: hypothetical protein VN922_16665 [Bacteroidia bacterium]|nr:hypothetical protein [Bacteroidia bacterium]
MTTNNQAGTAKTAEHIAEQQTPYMPGTMYDKFWQSGFVSGFEYASLQTAAIEEERTRLLAENKELKKRIINLGTSGTNNE